MIDFYHTYCKSGTDSKEVCFWVKKKQNSKTLPHSYSCSFVLLTAIMGDRGARDYRSIVKMLHIDFYNDLFSHASWKTFHFSLSYFSVTVWQMKPLFRIIIRISYHKALHNMPACLWCIHREARGKKMEWHRKKWQSVVSRMSFVFLRQG